MPKAVWRSTVIAESEDIINVEGNSYFPIESVNKEFLKECDTETVCQWKGTASYYSLQVGDAVNQDAAWYYSEPRPLADGIKGRVAFWKGVQVVRD